MSNFPLPGEADDDKNLRESFDRGGGMDKNDQIQF